MRKGAWYKFRPMALFIHHSRMPAPCERLAEWHFRPGALERLIPPWVRASIVDPGAGVQEGSVATIELRSGPLRARWKARHSAVEPGRGFVDEQISGPFSMWRHQHRFLPQDERHSLLEDHLEYLVPGGAAGRLVAGPWVRSQLRRTFEFRHRRTASDLRRHMEHPTADPLRVAVSGASGLVGSALCPFLSAGGHQIRRIVRGRPDHERLDIGWDQSNGAFERRFLEGVDAVVHLAGAGIADARWTPARREELRSSRILRTRQLAEALASLSAPPRVLVAASAIGWYGDRGEREVDERAERGQGFLPDLCAEWERATQPAEMAGIRVVHLRIGLVLSARGGALRPLRRIFSLGLGGPVGSGRQGMSWIALDDLLGAILFSIVTPSLYGAVNATAPTPRSNRDFGRALAHVLRRPFLIPAPGPAVRAALGEMGDALLLRGAFVRPMRLLEHGFRFQFPDLEPALRFELGRFLD